MFTSLSISTMLSSLSKLKSVFQKGSKSHPDFGIHTKCGPGAIWTLLWTEYGQERYVIVIGGELEVAST